MQFVRLTPPQKITHYLFPLMMAALGVIPVAIYLTGWAAQYLTSFVCLSAASVLFLAATVASIKQKWALRFHTIHTNNSSKVNAQIIRAILQEHGWQSVSITDDFLQATGHGFRHKLDLRTWAELMTFKLTQGEIKMNSICDPGGRAQFADFGKNKQNIRDFETLFKLGRISSEAAAVFKR
jgi:hypothetical protein